MTLKQTANKMIKTILAENVPEASVVQALENHDFKDKNVYLVAIGKAAFSMAKAASKFLGDKVKKGVVITKYDHAQGELPNIDVYEAGHPTLDENTVAATKKVLALVSDLAQQDEVLFLVSGGGSALFEAPQDGITLEDLADLNNQLLASGADIVEMNMIRKRLSQVKAGRFAEICQPATIFSVILSDVIGDRLDTIASGPAVPDYSTVADAMGVVKKYGLKLTAAQKKFLAVETPKEISNVKNVVTGSVKSLCESAAREATELGFTPYILTTTLGCEASVAGQFLASIVRDVKEGNSYFKAPCAIIVGGETIVNLKGKGKGGRNQELALSAATGIDGLDDVLVFSVGSDGTDGPTDAAGGIVDGRTVDRLKEKGLDIYIILNNNDAYHGLKAVDGLIMTGPTGTNVNDVSVVLIK